MSTPILQVEGLHTHFFTRQGIVRAVDDVSFSIAAGEVLGLVGESGSGKSMTGYSIIGLIDAPGKIVAGQILFDGLDLRRQNSEHMRQIRGNKIAMIFQDPMLTLNPVLRIDTQLVEAVQAHTTMRREEAIQRARETLVQVGIASPDERLQAYPHQFSGGMRQRIAIAIALLHRPQLIIADEPTTALDVTIQGQILFEMQKLAKETGTAMLWISHDLTVVAGLADRVAVMYGGKIVEMGSVQAVLEAPQHPYTRGLLDSVPGITRAGHGVSKRLHTIKGVPPSLHNLPEGCAFEPRCQFSDAQCKTMPPVVDSVRCWHPLRPLHG